MGGITTIGGRPSSGGSTGGSTGGTGGTTTVSGLIVGQAVQAAGGVGLIPMDGRVLSKAEYPELYAALNNSSIAPLSDFNTGATTMPSTGAWAVSYNAASNSFSAILTGTATTVGASSVDGVTWVSSVMPTSQSWYAIASNGTMFLAVGQMMSATSTDGVNWSNLTSLPLVSALTNASIAVVNGEFHVFSNTERAYMTTTNGTSWSVKGVPLAFVNKIVFTGEKYVAMSSGSGVSASAAATSVAISSDGVTWSLVPLPSSDVMMCMANIGATVCIIGAAKTYRSYDHGVTWTVNANTFGAVQALGASMTTASNKFLASIVQSNTAGVWQSTDTVTWTLAQGALNVTQFKSLGYSPSLGLYVASLPFTGSVMTSTDMINWTVRPLPLNSDWSAVVWNGTRFVILADVGTTSVVSTDGITWTIGSTTVPTGSKRPSASAVNSNNVAVVLFQGSVANCISSADGITWTSRTLPSTQFWQSIAVKGTTFVVAASGQVCASSADGTTWTARTVATPTNVVSDGTQFVSFKYNSTNIWTSPDGATWTARTPATTNAVFAALWWNGSVFVATALNGLNTQVSADGINWNITGTMANMSGFSYAQFWNQGSVAFTTVTRNNFTYICTSSGDPTGLTWTQTAFPIPYALSGNYFALGGQGADGPYAVGIYGNLSIRYDANAGSATVTSMPNTDNMNMATFYEPIWTGAQFIAVAKTVSGDAQPFFLTSPDGIEWTKHASPALTKIKPMWVNDTLVIIGDSGTYGMTGDGSWSFTSHPIGAVTSNMSANMVNNEGWVFYNSSSSAFGFSQSVPGRITDGLNMKFQVPVTSSGTPMASNGNTIVHVGASTINLSTDGGTTWTYNVAPFALSCVHFNPASNKFLALPSTAASSKGIYSGDGSMWRQFMLPLSATWAALTSMGKTVIAASTAGTSWAYSNNGGLTWHAMANPATATWVSLVSSPTVMVGGATTGTVGAYAVKTFDESTSVQVPNIPRVDSAPQWFIKAK